MFRDRADAGRRLAQCLCGSISPGEDVVVLALPRGGVPVAAEVARALHAPLDIALAHKIGAPMQPELAIGSVSGAERPSIVYDHAAARLMGLSADEVERLGREELDALAARAERYRGGRGATPIEGRTVVLVDDGVATGWTLRGAIAGARAGGAARVIVAVPVGPPEMIERLRSEADEVVCVLEPEAFMAVGSWYEEFSQVDDDEVVRTLGAFVRSA